MISITTAPYKIKLIKYFSLYVSLIMSPSIIANESGHEEELKLEKIQIRMGNVNKNIEEAKDKVKKLQIDLKNNEIITTKISEQLGNIQDRISIKNDELDKLNYKKENYQDILNKEKEILISQVRSIYQIGKYDYIKLLLNQQNLSQINRAIAYYNYDNYARYKRITKLDHILDDLNKVKLNISIQTSKLKSLKNDYKNKLNNFNENRKNRLGVIKDIKIYIQKQGLELVVLKQNEIELGKLLNELRLNKSNNIIAESEKSSFKSKKGKLHWPIKGKLLKKFGTKKKVTGLKWRGVLIEAKAGSEVSAVSEGKIVFANWFRNFGLLVIIEHENGYLSLYGHNQKILKITGDFVKTGEKIATVGDSGGQSNSALYFEIRKGRKTLNPSHWCKKADQM